MAKWDDQSLQNYEEGELADAQQNPDYAAEESDMPEEQYNSPEKMRKPNYDNKGKLSQSQGYKG